MIHNHIIRMLAMVIFFSGISGAFAEEDIWTPFYSNDMGNQWKASGRKSSNVEHSPICIVGRFFPDGSMIHITKDMRNGEFYIWIQNTDWILKEGNDKYRLQINMYRGNRFLTGGKLEWTINSKNTMQTNYIEPKNFLKALWDATNINFIMPENVDNIYTHVNGRAVVNQMDRCIQAYKALPAEKMPDVSGPVTPDQVKKERGKI